MYSLLTVLTVSFFRLNKEKKEHKELSELDADISEKKSTEIWDLKQK